MEGTFMRCNATSKRTGKPCGKHAITGRNVCLIHGGKTPAGTASGRFTSGKYSRYMPSQLLDRYEEAIHDSALLELRDDIALVDVRIADLLACLDTGESGGRWKAVHQAFKAYESAHGTAGEAAALGTLQDAIMANNGDYEVWADVSTWLEQRRKLCESERKRLVDMHQYVSVKQMMVLLAQVTASVRQHITDPQVLRAISADLSRLVSTPNHRDPSLA
jgi:hypothetical protein